MIDLNYKFKKPDLTLADFVDSFWMLANRADEEKEVVVLPDGRFDIFFCCSATEPFHITIK